MSYQLAERYVCPTCEHEFSYSQSHIYDHPIIDGEPTCPECWKKFVKLYVPIAKRKDYE